MKRLIITIVLIFPLLLHANEKKHKGYDPWYTGPLIAASANNVDKYQQNVQPYLYIADTYARYNKSWGYQTLPSTYTVTLEMSYQYGILKWMDITLDAHGFYKNRSGTQSVEYGDTTAKLGFQLLRDKKGTAIPSIRFTLEESFPTGKYQKLSPHKNGIDASGSGSFETIPSLNLSKTVFWMKEHPISWRFNFTYLHSLKTSVKGFNAYGGGIGTKGKVNPGNTFTGILAFEFSFTQRWVFAMDIVQTYSSKVRFKGNPGLNEDGTVASNSTGISERTSLAPALEYNFNSMLGIVWGVHFSVRGKNATDFITGIFSVTYTW